MVQRTDLMPAGYVPGALPRIRQFASFFAISDIHITDKEAPNQFIYLQQEDATFSGSNTSIYSPVMPYTTQVLDAAIQTVNALHAQAPFDFGLSLGDAANSTSYNELRWYIDVIDGKVITPSSGAHLGAATVDYQMPYQAAGLDRSIPFYQAIGNHDHFQIGSFPVYADPSLGLAEAYVAGHRLGDAGRPRPVSSELPAGRQHGQPEEPDAPGATGPLLPGGDRRQLADRRDHRRGTGRIPATARRRSRPIPTAAPCSRRSGSGSSSTPRPARSVTASRWSTRISRRDSPATASCRSRACHSR